MLEALRTAAHSWIAKLLFIVLILSFGIWGVGDMAKLTLRQSSAITVGKTDISAEEVLRQYKREVTRLQRMFGPQFTEEQARQMGLLDSTIDQIAARTLLDQAAKDLGLIASDEAVMAALAANPSFRNELGQFDRYKLRQAFTQAGYTEDQFIAVARYDLVRSQLINAVSDGITAPTAEVQTLFTYRGEKRVVDQYVFSADKMPNPPAPDEATLKGYYDAHGEAFMAPEYRGISAIVLRPEDVAAEVKVSDKDIEEAYAQRAAEFVEPEHRTLSQIVYTDEAKAKQAEELALQGKELKDIATATGGSVVELGAVTRQDLAELSPELADAVFGQAKTGVAPPVKSLLGWHLVDVISIQPGKERALSEVRDQLKADLIHDRAIDQLYAVANKVEDTLATGASPDEAAQKLGLKVIKAAAVDPQGKGPDGKPVAGLPASAAFLRTVFETAEGGDSRTQELENNAGFYMVHIDKVTPPVVRAFETVKDEVLKAWQGEQRLAAARKAAEEALAAVKEGKAPTGATAQTSQPFTRSPSNPSGVPAPVVSEAFRLKPGEAGMITAPDGAVVAVLKSVVPADPQADSAALAQLGKQVSQQMAGDMVDQLVANLHTRYRVVIHRGVIEERLK
jgi:peptidyl-prolyl cis-trans isomerase D